MLNDGQGSLYQAASSLAGCLKPVLAYNLDI